ncbi:hypothetical protein PEC18_02655 [Paucibacter sp. O1-1]|nr:tetratricopeptide repeat protein [Paucibacter sp. M5-1]MCU7369794.1 hypothetical protein [Paucibacter sp. O1-1]MCZ7884897.1 hypothetical protein [Paucibacter sp. M5-1]MDA3824779.1 hypothetical protein [Paucibacter sp. O1-1]
MRSDHGQALAFYQEVLKLQPDNPAANNNVAWLLKMAKKPGALAYAEKANRLRPNQPPFMDTLAEIHADAGQFDKALEVQQQAVKLAPEVHLHRLHLARYYLRAGQKSAAQEELKKLAELGDKFAQHDEVKKLQAEL